MASVKISELTALTAPAAADELAVVDVSANSTKKTTVGEVVGIINGDVEVANDGTATISELPVSKLQDGAARQLLQTDAAGTGVEWTSNIDIPGTLDVTGAATLDSTLTVPLGSAAAPTLRFTGDPNTGVYSPGADQVAISTNGTGRLFVDASGNFIFKAAGYIEYGDYGTPNSGNPGIRLTGDQYPQINISSGYFGDTGSRTKIEFINGNGTVGTIVTNGSATAYNTSSDYRLKENVAPLTGAADRLNQLQVHRFNFIADPDKTVDGFIAHEAQAVVPECVTGTKDEVDDDGNPVYQGIDQSKLVPLLTAALQEALAEIESLKARVTALEP
jgi:hypothetical protein